MNPRKHRLIRLLALVVIAASLTYITQRSGARKDLTAEGLSQITSDTRELIRSIGTDVEVENEEGETETRTIPPVIVTAYVSKEVPRAYVPLRTRLLNILREMEASGGPGLTVRIYEPEPFSKEASEAMEKYGIFPRPLTTAEGGKVETVQVFLGVAMSSGPREEVVPFFDRGLSVEYEIVRALEVVTQPKKKVVGIIRDDTKIMGDFDLQARRRIPRWRVIQELEKQYEVRSLQPGTPIDKDAIDVLFVPQISSLSQGALDVVQAYLLAGRPALIIADPFPFFDPRLAPGQPMLPPPQQGGMMGGAPPSEPKGNYRALLASIGVEWPDHHVAFDLENPEPQLADAPRTIIVAGQRDGKDQFAGRGAVVEGLAQIVVLFGGDLRIASSATTEIEPLLSTGRKGGWDDFNKMVDPGNFLTGLRYAGLPSQPERSASEDGLEDIKLGLRVTGGSSGADGNSEVNAIVLADLDMFSDSFFALHERGGDLDADGLIDMRFDNVTFLLNAIDELLGDERFIELRKRQPGFRRLTKVDEMTKEANEERQAKIEEANEEAESKVAKAQAALDAEVARIRAQEGIDETTKQIQIGAAKEAADRQLQAQTEQIEQDKAKQIDEIKAEHARAVDEVRDRIRVAVVLVPPLPAILFGMVIFMRKRRREKSTIPESRKRRDS